MKKYISVILLAFLIILPASAKVKHHMLTRQQDTIFWHTPSVAYSLELGCSQPWLRFGGESFAYLYGANLGFRVDWSLRRVRGFALSTGARFTVANGKNTEYGPHSSPIGNFQQECVKYNMTTVNLTVPLQFRYDVRMYRDWHIFFFGGPELDFGLAFRNKVENLLTDGTTTDDDGLVLNTRGLYAQLDPKSWSNMYSGTEGMYQNGRVWPFALHMGVGGGFRWKHWALQGSYSFGLTNQSRLSNHKDMPLNTWRWQAGIAYTF